jgi:hypothetical protein
MKVGEGLQDNLGALLCLADLGIGHGRIAPTQKNPNTCYPAIPRKLCWKRKGKGDVNGAMGM